MALRIAGSADAEIPRLFDFPDQFGRIVVNLGGLSVFRDIPPEGQYILNPMCLQLLKHPLYLLPGG